MIKVIKAYKKGSLTVFVIYRLISLQSSDHIMEKFHVYVKFLFNLSLYFIRLLGRIKVYLEVSLHFSNSGVIDAQSLVSPTKV